MKSLLSDWCAFCEGRAVFDKSHFLGLLKAHSGSEELRRIFSYFPFSEELVDRAERVLASGDMEKSLYLLPKLKVGEGELIQLGREWLKEQERVCGVLGDSEVLKICENAQVLFVDGHDMDHWLQQDIPHYWLFDEIGDAIRGAEFLILSRLMRCLRRSMGWLRIIILLGTLGSHCLNLILIWSLTLDSGEPEDGVLSPGVGS
ncbi:hypothetical protein THH46_24020 [Pseudomonas sp. NA13]